MKMYPRKMARDKVISIVDNGQDTIDLVGVYWEGTGGAEILFECPPKIADKIIKIWNTEYANKNK